MPVGAESPDARQRASSSGSMLTSSANTSSSANACLHIAPESASGHVHATASSVRSGISITGLVAVVASSTGSATIVTRYGDRRLPSTSPTTAPGRTSRSITAPSRA